MKTRKRSLIIGGTVLAATLTIGSLAFSQSVQAQGTNQTQITDVADLASAQATASRLIEASSMMADLDPSSVTDQSTLNSQAFKELLAARVRDVYADSKFDETFKNVQDAAQLIHDEKNFKHYNSVSMDVEAWHGASRNTEDGTVLSSFKGALTFHFSDHDVTEPSYEWSVVSTGLDSTGTQAKLVSYIAEDRNQG